MEIPFDDESWTTSQWYEPASTTNTVSDREELFRQLDDVLDTVFSRLRSVCNDRPLLLSLSGGYDSRLVALMLAQCDFDDIYAICRTTQSRYDVAVSKQVAEQFGFE